MQDRLCTEFGMVRTIIVTCICTSSSPTQSGSSCLIFLVCLATLREVVPSPCSKRDENCAAPGLGCSEPSMTTRFTIRRRRSEAFDLLYATLIPLI